MSDVVMRVESRPPPDRAMTLSEWLDWRRAESERMAQKCAAIEALLLLDVNDAQVN